MQMGFSCSSASSSGPGRSYSSFGTEENLKNRGYFAQTLPTEGGLQHWLEEASQQRLATTVAGITAHRLDPCKHTQGASGGELASQLTAEGIDRNPDNFMHEPTRSVPEVDELPETFLLNQSWSEVFGSAIAPQSTSQLTSAAAKTANVGGKPSRGSNKIISPGSNKIITNFTVTSTVEAQVRPHHELKAGSELLQNTLQLPVAMTCQQQCNAGSRGHPEVCKPCRLFQSGRCVQMGACNFCHLPHPRRPPSQLGKRNRELLANLLLGMRGKILLDAMRSRSQDTSFEHSAHIFVDTIESQCRYFLIPDGAHIQDEKGLKRLCGALQGELLSSLISLFFKTVVSELEQPVVAAIREAQTKLQSEIEI